MTSDWERRLLLPLQLFTRKHIFIAFITIIIGIILYLYLSVFIPIIMAILTALIIEPVVKVLQKYLHFKRLPAVVTVFTAFVCFISVIFYLAITKLVNEAVKFITRLPFYIYEVNLFAEETFESFNDAVSGLPPNLIIELEKQLDTIYDIGNDLAEQAVPLLSTWAQNIPNMIIIIIIYLISLFLISLELPKYVAGFYARFKDENVEKVQYMFHRSARVFTGFFKAQFLVSIIIFIVSYLALLIISPKNALLMAIIIWIIDFIPIIGSISILAPWGLFELISGHTDTGIQLLILAAVLLIIRRTVEPKVMGDHIGLPALPTLLGLYFGFYFLGVVGLIIGPLMIITFLSAREAGIIKWDFKI